MKTNKATTFTVAVIAIAMVAFTIVITWMSSVLPSSSNYMRECDYDYIDEAGLPTPEDVYDYTGPAETGQPISNDLPWDEYYPETMPDTNEEYTLPEDYPAYDFIPIFTREPLPRHIIDQITGVTFHDNTPFDHDYLTYLTVTHVNFDGESIIGHLIVAADIGDEVLEIFQEIYEGRFPIYSIRLIDYFYASDYLSMAANNSHAFNFRYIAGTNIISRHGFGIAIDINPIQNPYIRGDTVWPAAGAAYLDRSYVRPGMIIPGDVVYTAFTSRGWIWGGHWTTPRDYHHFERRR